MDLEQFQVLIDLFHQPQSLHHPVHRPHAAVAGRADLAAQLVMNIAPAHHRLGLLLPVAWSQTVFDSALAVAEDFGVVSAHSKCRFHGLRSVLNKPISTNAYRHFEYFRSKSRTKSRLLRA
jgi:hypothetical protein